jgi:hypothetical protein
MVLEGHSRQFKELKNDKMLLLFRLNQAPSLKLFSHFIFSLFFLS